MFNILLVLLSISAFGSNELFEKLSSNEGHYSLDSSQVSHKYACAKDFKITSYKQRSKKRVYIQGSFLYSKNLHHQQFLKEDLDFGKIKEVNETVQYRNVQKWEKLFGSNILYTHLFYNKSKRANSFYYMNAGDFGNLVVGEGRAQTAFKMSLITQDKVEMRFFKVKSKAKGRFGKMLGRCLYTK